MAEEHLDAKAENLLGGIDDIVDADAIEQQVKQEHTQIDQLINAAVGAALTTHLDASRRLVEFVDQLYKDFGRAGALRAIHLLCTKSIGPYGHTCHPHNVMSVDIDLSKVDAEDVPQFARVKHTAEAFLTAILSSNNKLLAQANESLTEAITISVLIVLVRHLATIINTFAVYQADAYDAYDELSVS